MSGSTWRGHFGAHTIDNVLDEPITWAGVRVDDHVIGDISLLGQYGQRYEDIGLPGDFRGYWDEWPPHQSTAPIEPDVMPLEFPVTVPPGESLNPLVGFEADTSEQDVHVPYLIYDYEVGGRDYQLVDPMGIRLVQDEQTCETMPEIFEWSDG